MSAENIRSIESQTEGNSHGGKPSNETETHPSSEQQQQGANVVYEAPNKKSEEAKPKPVDLSKDEKTSEPQRKGVRYLGAPKAFGHPVFSAQIEAADPFKRYGVPDSAAALPGTRVRPRKRPRNR